MYENYDGGGTGDDGVGNDGGGDENLNCLKNGEHGEGVEALADDRHHIRMVNICPNLVLLIILKYFITIAIIVQTFDLSESVKLLWLCLLPQDFHHYLTKYFNWQDRFRNYL